MGTIDYSNVTFTWTGTDDVTPTAQLVYSYILESYDTSWSDWTSNTSMAYNNLPNGNYTFKVKAKDQADNIDPTPAERAFTVFVGGNLPPIANFTYTPENPVVNQTITFNASNSSDPDGFIVKYVWNFGDSSAGEGKVVTHSYSSPVDYIVTLNVIDDEGAKNTTSREVKVKEEAKPRVSIYKQTFTIRLRSASTDSGSTRPGSSLSTTQRPTRFSRRTQRTGGSCLSQVRRDGGRRGKNITNATR